MYIIYPYPISFTLALFTIKINSVNMKGNIRSSMTDEDNRYKRNGKVNFKRPQLVEKTNKKIKKMMKEHLYSEYGESQWIFIIERSKNIKEFELVFDGTQLVVHRPHLFN